MKQPSFPNLTIVDHPLIADKLARLRHNNTPPHKFRMLLEDISLLLFYEAGRLLPLKPMPIRTPLEETEGFRLSKEIVLVPILRAGMGMVNGIVKLFPAVQVGMVGMYRDEETLQPVDYYLRLPDNLHRKEVFLLDPMLATGGSARNAVDILKKNGARHIYMISIIAAPEGVQLMLDYHPTIPIFTAALDRQLNDKGFILPGLGDAGDRYFGT